MAEPISNQQHSTLSPRQVEFIDSFLEPASPHRRKHWLPKDLRRASQAVTTPIAVQPLQIIRDADAANHRILQEDQLDIQAARTILGERKMACNAINVKHYRWILKSLLDHMLSNPNTVPHSAEYARILQRLSKRLTTLTNDNTIELQQPHSKRACRHRLSHVEYLDKLLRDMEKGFVVMQQRGIEDEVYLVTDINQSHLVGHSAHLKSLASHLSTDRPGFF